MLDENGQTSIDRVQFKDWTIQEFPNLFFGFHNLFFQRIKDLKFVSLLSVINQATATKNTEQLDLKFLSIRYEES